MAENIQHPIINIHSNLKRGRRPNLGQPPRSFRTGQNWPKLVKRMGCGDQWRTSPAFLGPIRSDQVRSGATASDLVGISAVLSPEGADRILAVTPWHGV